MKRKSLAHYNCSWAQAAEAVGDRWSIMIIRDAFYGVKTFSAFAKNIGIAKNILSQRLEHLQNHKILEKRPISVGSQRFEYCLTEKGFALFPVIAALGQWGDKWIFGEGKEPLIVVDLENKEPIEQMEVKSSDGRVLTLRDITFKAGPGATDETKKIAEQIRLSLS
ncbi:winged helix-turn-helix transcriptional regulator [Agarilytica rhodophyticola]|uniref:winged helix-turn-helix transcriptional regulator n=1 Tax=Agarilytica rhodophyticola TaxID=1737490 RepID=UPI000CD8B84C|nr:helix-turn-helix domain-containing protein [Agarilytica rhodophyticola]